MVSLLGIAAVVMAYFCVMSVVTPISFENTREARQVAVIQNLIYLRTAEVEFNREKGHFTADLDSLVLFLKTTPKKEVLKEGSLTDKQLEAGLTEHKAVKIMNAAKAKALKKQQFESEDAQLRGRCIVCLCLGKRQRSNQQWFERFPSRYNREKHD